MRFGVRSIKRQYIFSYKANYLDIVHECSIFDDILTNTIGGVIGMVIGSAKEIQIIKKGKRNE